jgi:hypothetical protein
MAGTGPGGGGADDVTMRSAFCRAVLLSVGSAAISAFGAAQRSQPPVEQRELIQGAELMSAPEGNSCRGRWSGAAALAARQPMRREHRARPLERARKRGLNRGASGVVASSGMTRRAAD